MTQLIVAPKPSMTDTYDNIYKSVISRQYDVTVTRFFTLFQQFKNSHNKRLIHEIIKEINISDLVDLIENFSDHVGANFYDVDLPEAVNVARKHVLFSFLDQYSELEISEFWNEIKDIDYH